jgi:hypothetical protein
MIKCPSWRLGHWSNVLHIFVLPPKYKPFKFKLSAIMITRGIRVWGIHPQFNHFHHNCIKKRILCLNCSYPAYFSHPLISISRSPYDLFRPPAHPLLCNHAQSSRTILLHWATSHSGIHSVSGSLPLRMLGTVPCQSARARWWHLSPILSWVQWETFSHRISGLFGLRIIHFFSHKISTGWGSMVQTPSVAMPNL